MSVSHSFYGQVIVHSMAIPPVVYPLSVDRHGVFLPFSSYEYSCTSVTVLKPPLRETKEVNTTYQCEVQTIISSKANKGKRVEGVLEGGS